MSNAVRACALRALYAAGNGHVGIVLGASNIITTIYANHLRRGRDRFVLSAGHGSAMLYATLKLAGYDVGKMESFRTLGGLPGHPEIGIDGVDATTGPLGQGVGNAVGMALAAKLQNTDGRVYCLCGDGDLMEGISAEAISFAGIYKLNNLVLLWDDNGVSIDGAALTDINVPMRMRAAGWNVVSVGADDLGRMNHIIDRAATSRAPTFVRVRTTIGAGSSVAGKHTAHGFGISGAEVLNLANKYASDAGTQLWATLASAVSARYPTRMADIRPCDIAAPFLGTTASTRELSGVYLGELMKCGIRLIGGSADLAHSTNAKTDAHHDITPENPRGNFINYGVREHAMGAIMNGMAACGLRPYGSTFLVFSDYMRPAIRLAALGGLPVIYLFTHDSICVGPDGPTHQPIEQLPSLRLIPNLNVFRPCNGAEVASAWRMAIADTTRPSALILSRQKFEQIATPAGADITRGGYIIYDAKKSVKITIIATGAEVALAINVAKKLGPGVRVVSMPSVAHFRANTKKYKSDMLRGTVIAIEAAATPAWFEFADIVIGIDEFGASGDGNAVYKHFGFDADMIAENLKRYV